MYICTMLKKYKYEKIDKKIKQCGIINIRGMSNERFIKINNR